MGTIPEDKDQVRALIEELSRLKEQIRRQPSSWALGRIAAIEGLLAAHREAAAWVETRAIIAKCRGG